MLLERVEADKRVRGGIGSQKPASCGQATGCGRRAGVDGSRKTVDAGAMQEFRLRIRPRAGAVLSGWSQIGGFGGPNTLQIFPVDGTLPGSGSSLIAAQQTHSRNGPWQVQD